MKPVLLYRSLLFTLFIFAGIVAAAQDTATTKFLDSLKTPPPVKADTSSSVGVVVDSTVAATDEPAEETYPVDTVVISNIRVINADTFAAIKRDKGFYYQQWLDSLLRAEEGKVRVQKKPPELPNLDKFTDVLQVVLWVFAAAVLLFILYKLFLGNNALFLRNRKNIEAVVDTAEDIPAGRYEGLIAKAEAENNYRLAVRYLHLQVLYNLSERGFIRVGTEKTNYEYLNEMRNAPAAIAKRFSDLTYKYEYIWYGEYPVSSDMYHSLREQFVSFNKEITAR